MNISYSWLKEFLDFDLKVDEISEILTDIGLEVEGINKYERFKGGLKGLVVGKVLKCIKHSNADRLKLTTVDIGNEKPLQIVCGAPNVDVNQTVVVATVGTILFNINGDEFKISKSKIRGEISEGMICAEDEIGIGESHDGIIVLEDKHKAGKKISKIYDSYEDIIFDLALTPNRSDAMSHYGVARDLRAALMNKGYKTELISPSISSFYINSRTKRISVIVKDNELCPRFSGLCIENIKINTSPVWLQNKLKSIGLSPINNVVDITNYVLHEIGQPLHAYDLEKIKSNTIEVKRLKKNTSFKTLDGIERKLNSTDLVICDKNTPMCIAGVFGGENHGITNETNSIFLESAFFNPVSIRKTAKSHLINSDASFRFERGIDIEMVDYALKRAAILICEICGGNICSDIIDEYPKRLELKSIVLNYEKTNNLIGQTIPSEKMKSILTSLDFKINNITETGVGITVPSYRHDVTRECDVVEEILRIYGFNEIKLSNKLSISINSVDKNLYYKTEESISSYLNSLGFNEIMNNSLTNNNLNLFDRKDIKIINSISSDISKLRTTLLESSLKTLKYNINRNNKNTKFFEFGKIYEKIGNNNLEKRRLSILYSGEVVSNSWKQKSLNADFYSLKNIVVNLLLKLSINYKERIIDSDGFSSALGLYFNNNRLAIIGSISEKIKSEFDINQDVYYASIDIDYLLKLLSSNFKKYEPFSKFPIVYRDLAFILDKNITYSEIKELLFKSGIKNLVDMKLFDVYEGEKIPNEKKSYAMNFSISNNEKTLNDKEIHEIMNKIQKNIETKFNGILRDK
ncbi:MAG: phenylalanine--tRNA ligase subunit beta [Flavobacteriaceae bacterium]|nr:phenylalanine--tRNA ligase subunit beta [Flavobacteriaceae bacterium]